ncbi:hypothetical protein NTJ28_002641, partial [Flavobacterium psychrophilum]|nr:hypothetical protein [Flavobacterium psychrophilum]
LVSITGKAQQTKDTTKLLEYNFRWFGPYPRDTTWLKNVKPVQPKKPQEKPILKFHNRLCFVSKP